MEPSDLKGLFDAFYERLVLRDFFGKIVPGLVLISTVLGCLVGVDFGFSGLVTAVSQLSALGWLALFGAAWLTAFALQAFGESFPPKDRKKRMIHYYPPELFANDEVWYEFRDRFQKSASAADRTQAERLVVIKEACGNGYVSVGISILFAVTFAGLSFVFGDATFAAFANQLSKDTHRWLPLALLAVFLMIFLRKMHWIHVWRQYRYMKGVVDRSERSGGNVMGRFAIVLRGPVAVGKTTVGWVLLSKLGQTKGTIHLDKEWGPEERRSKGGSERYADLENREESILVLELAYGEPNLFGPNGTVNLGTSLGATRDPGEWVGILKRQGREVISVVIWDTWEHVEERLRSRGQKPSATLRVLYDLYQKSEWTEFHTKAGIRELRIDANGRSPIEVASDILSELVTLGLPLRILSASLRARP